MGQQRSLTFLGTGTSVGVPVIGCSCLVCLSDNPRNQRYRSSVLVRTDRGDILIDTGPEMRLQLVREKNTRIKAVIYTHYHADHILGIDDLRMVAFQLDQPVPLYCNEEVEKVIRQTFSYAFNNGDFPSRASIPRLEFHRIDRNPFEVLGQHIIPIPLIHGNFEVFGFRIGDMAYCTDVSYVPNSSWDLLAGIRVLIIDALRFKPHTAHLSLNEALEVIDRIGPDQAYLTHMSHEFDYNDLNPKLPVGVEMAYDGLTIEF